MKHLCWLLGLFLTLAGCQSPYRSDLQAKLLAQCPDRQDGCLVRLAAATDFVWTQCYLFPQMTGNARVSEQIGSPYSFAQEFSLSVVYLKGQAVVYHEEIPVPLEHYEPGDLSFSALCPGDECVVYTPQTAVFRLRRDPSAAFYSLLPY